MAGRQSDDNVGAIVVMGMFSALIAGALIQNFWLVIAALGMAVVLGTLALKLGDFCDWVRDKNKERRAAKGLPPY